MSDKKFETPLAVLEHLREYLLGYMNVEKDSMMMSVMDWDDFERGKCNGAYFAYEETYLYIKDLIHD